MLLFFCVYFCLSLYCCVGEEGDVGYSLKIGHAIDVFANYGDLCLVTQVISADGDDEDSEETAEPFREKNIRIFESPQTIESIGGAVDTNMNIIFCDTFQDLMDNYFQDFNIEGATKPWRAFMGDWIPEEIMRTLGMPISLGLDMSHDNCCHVLVKLIKTHRSVKMAELTGPVAVREYVKRAMKRLNSTEPEMRKFMKNYGTHYIDSYVTGNFIYQVFKYKRTGYNLLKDYMRRRRKSKKTIDDLRFYFASYFLRHVGDIRIASGNKTTEAWARENLKDSQYLYSRPSLMRLKYNPVLVSKLNDLLNDSALIALNLKTLKPIFEDPKIGDKFAEIVQNDMLLWEVNG